MPSLPSAALSESVLSGVRDSTRARSTPGRRVVMNHHVLTVPEERLARIPQPHTRYPPGPANSIQR